MVELTRTPKRARKKTAGRPKGAMLASSELISTILSVARRHFARHGYQGANLKDIAKEAKVANSLITYHFKGKESLYRQCMESFARDRMESVNRLLKDPETTEELRLLLKIFVDEIFVSYIKDPESFFLVQREIHSDNPVAAKVFEATFLNSFFNVVQFFARAKKKGLISKKLTPELLAIFLFSVTCDNANKDRLAQKYMGKSLNDPQWRKQMSDQIVELFMSGVQK